MVDLEILTYPNTKLRQKCEPVDLKHPDLSIIISSMVSKMYSSKGLGLAAIQIGIPFRLFILDGDRLDPTKTKVGPLIFVNPEEPNLSGDRLIEDEFCLSFPGIGIPIERSDKVSIRAQDGRGYWFRVEGEGLFAKAIQHEYDHVMGKLLIDYVSPLKKKLIEKRLLKSKKK